MGRRSELTRGQQQNIRANLARKATQLGNRLVQNAMGELPEELSAGQIKSILGVLGHVLPTMQSVETTDLTPDTRTGPELKQEIQEARQRLIESLTPEELQQVQTKQVNH